MDDELLYVHWVLWKESGRSVCKRSTALATTLFNSGYHTRCTRDGKTETQVKRLTREEALKLGLKAVFITAYPDASRKCATSVVWSMQIALNHHDIGWRLFMEAGVGCNYFHNVFPRVFVTYLERHRLVALFEDGGLYLHAYRSINAAFAVVFGNWYPLSAHIRNVLSEHGVAVPDETKREGLREIAKQMAARVARERATWHVIVIAAPRDKVICATTASRLRWVREAVCMVTRSSSSSLYNFLCIQRAHTGI